MTTATTPSAIITGITGQDGAYLAQCLLARGYRVYGTFRRGRLGQFLAHPRSSDRGPRAAASAWSSTCSTWGSGIRILERWRSHYNHGRAEFRRGPFDQPINTGLTTGLGVVNLLEAIRIVDTRIRFYQASTSEMFGRVRRRCRRTRHAVLPAQPLRRRPSSTRTG